MFTLLMFKTTKLRPRLLIKVGRGEREHVVTISKNRAVVNLSKNVNKDSLLASAVLTPWLLLIGID